MQVSVLGPLAVRTAAGDVAVTGVRLRRLLVALALAGGRPVQTATIIAAVWRADDPGADAASANALQSLVSRLRRALGGADTVLAGDDGYRLALRPADVDALAFEADARDAARRAQAHDVDGAVEAYARAEGRWAGDPDDTVVDPALARGLVERRLTVAAARAGLELAARAPAEEVARRVGVLHAAHPLDEPLAAVLVRALAAAGRPAEALAVFEQVREHLADSLGADPSPALRAAHLEVLRGEPATPPAASPPPAAPTRRSALPAALTSFVGRDDDVARVVEAVETTRLVTVLGPGGSGKTRLATEAARRLESGRPGGVTLVELAPVTDPREIPGTVLAALGRREAVDRGGSVRTLRTEAEIVEALVDSWGDSDALLVLDNLEHLLDAAAALVDTLLAGCARLRVLTTSREPTGLAGEAVIALAPLPVPAEGDPPAVQRASPAVRLFLDRARAVGAAVDATADLPAVVTIARRLDGLPLALELAAARLRTTPVAAVARRLDDRFRLLTTGSRAALPRHRTLRAVVAWSWDLLEPRERDVADRLAVFPGGVSPDAAAAVCDPPIGEDEAADLLAALADKSLLQPVPCESGAPRYRMLETLREYGTDRLAERGELAAVRRAHTRWFAGFARRADAGLRSADQLAWLRRLRAEYGNLTAALGEAYEHDPRTALTMTLDLTWWWLQSGRTAEAAAWVRAATELPRDLDPDASALARAVYAMGMAAGTPAGADPSSTDVPDPDRPTAGPRNVRGEPADLVAAMRRAALDLSPDDDRWAPVRLTLRMIAFFLSGEHEAAQAALAGALAHPDPWIRATATGFSARIAENLGDVDQARADAEAAVTALRALGDHLQRIAVVTLVATLRTYDGDLVGAEAALREALQFLDETGEENIDERAYTLMRLGDCLARQGRHDEALAVAGRLLATPGVVGVELRGMGLVLYAGLLAADPSADPARVDAAVAEADRELQAGPQGVFGANHAVALVGTLQAGIAVRRGELDEAQTHLLRAYPAALRSADMPVVALVGVAVARRDLAAGDAAGAARRLGAAARARGADDPTDLSVREVTALGRAAVGDEVWDAAWRSGWALPAADAARALDPAAPAAHAATGAPVALTPAG